MLLRQPRRLSLLAIAAGHVVFIYLLQRCLAPSLSGARTDASAIVVTFIPELEKPGRPETGWSLPVKQPRKPTVKEAPEWHESEQPTYSITDWESQAQAAAEEVLREEREKEKQRTFSHTFPATPAHGNGGVFGSEKENRRAGLVEGGEDFWVTDNCYFDFPRLPPLPHAAGEFHLLTPVCKPPPTGGGGNMFQALRPEYMQGPQPKQPLPGAKWARR